MNLIKQLGFYVDCVGGEFQHPREFGEEHRDEMEEMYAIATERLESIRTLHSTPEASLTFAEQGGDLLRILYFSPSEEEGREALRTYLRQRNERMDKK